MFNMFQSNAKFFNALAKFYNVFDVDNFNVTVFRASDIANKG